MAVASSHTSTSPSSPQCSQLQYPWNHSYPSFTESVFVHVDGTKVTEKVIGQGATGIVIEQGHYALKVPYISRHIKIDGVPVELGSLTPKEGEYDDRIPVIEAIGVEKAIYRRLGSHDGIVRCYDLETSDPSIRMERMSGDLRHFLKEQEPQLPRRILLSWFAQLAHTMAYIHEHRIIIADIRLDNLLLNHTLDVKFCDFGESTLMPLEWDLSGTDELGYSILNDIGQYGAVMYQVITGRECKFDLTRKGSDSLYSGPRRDDLPSTESVWLGHIIENCWTLGFQSSKELAAALDRAPLP
ncbi:hypothetical protein AYO20_08855 [Fonsecaea nubica]|uniref:Protein kinase domain-containing protein n=1 Tax=Fonsecaea nubica TaxID=856822 RepID=A0A178CJJ8_9EURO|nr:hypothetical protein AYO20_08855 [Fonsecaea nubica]OAL30139.1 hypothetical protein AYO20_08855 [Fonsecaea nubica]